VIHRPWLMLSAAVTVTIPGVLAILAVLGQEHAAAGESAGLAATSLSDSSLSGPVPVPPAKTKAAVRNAVAGAQRMSGASVTVEATTLSGGEALGLRLLSRAAQASQALSYQGTELMSEAGAGGEATTISQVWHRGGGLTLTQTKTSSADADVMRSPAGVFGVTRVLVGLLGEHYVALYRGTSYTVGRPAALVEVYRFDGSLAARFWLDRQTLVPLRRELFDTSDRPIGEDAFVTVQFGALTAEPATAEPATAKAAMAETAKPARAAASATVSARPAWVTAGSPDELLASLAGQGWRLPATLPGGLPLYAAESSGTGTGEVIDLQYSDGLSVVSLFVQRGTLAPDMAGWRPATLGGHQVYVSGRSVTWSWHGLVCTVITDAPPRTVAQAVAALPRSTPAGLLNRLGHGLDRLAQLANPFG
jgi:sigma-E factor negative regulatory protein RseB